jgi:hypothetical protein
MSSLLRTLRVTEDKLDFWPYSKPLKFFSYLHQVHTRNEYVGVYTLCGRQTFTAEKAIGLKRDNKENEREHEWYICVLLIQAFENVVEGLTNILKRGWVLSLRERKTELKRWIGGRVSEFYLAAHWKNEMREELDLSKSQETAPKLWSNKRLEREVERKGEKGKTRRRVDGDEGRQCSTSK